MKVVPGSFEVSRSAGPVSCLSLVPNDAAALLLMAHGAGAGMHHHGMESIAAALAVQGVATLRYQFPYMESGRRMPDRLPTRLETVGAAVETAAGWFPSLPLLAGGRSMGGRMSSSWLAEHPGSPVAGLVFFGFPLHPPGRPGTARARHLDDVDVPMLFLQGTRDALGSLDLLEPVCGALGARATLHVVEGADHSFRVLRRSGRTDADVVEELAVATRRFIDERILQAG